MSLRNITKLVPAIAPSVRSIHTSPAARSGHDTRGVFGSNVPFPVHNRYTLLTVFCVFFASGLALPFLTLRSMVVSRNQN